MNIIDRENQGHKAIKIDQVIGLLASDVKNEINVNGSLLCRSKIE